VQRDKQEEADSKFYFISGNIDAMEDELEIKYFQESTINIDKKVEDLAIS